MRRFLDRLGEPWATLLCTLAAMTLGLSLTLGYYYLAHGDLRPHPGHASQQLEGDGSRQGQ